MYRILLIAVCLVWATGCVSKSDYEAAMDRIDRLESELNTCTGQVAELQQTPLERLSRARQAEQEGNNQEAERLFQTLVQRYPDTEEAGLAQAALTDLTRRREQAKQDLAEQRREEERKRTLGFRSIRPADHVTVGATTLHVDAVSLRDQWEFDRYGNTSRYVDTRRGQQYLVVDLDISSNTHNPSLPPLYVYRIEGNLLVQKGRLEYKFARWADESAFRGSSTDAGNDFAYTKIIPFTAGVILEEPLIYEPLFVLVGNTGCYNRVNDDATDPPVHYVGSNCGGNLAMTVEDLEKNGYTVIKIINEGVL